jgi:HSP20 family protein
MTVRVEVAGVQKDHIQFTVADDHLVVRGETRKEEHDKRKSYYRREIRYGAFQRTIALPFEVDARKASAELKNRVLTVSLPKSTQPKARDIKVAVG